MRITIACVILCLIAITGCAKKKQTPVANEHLRPTYGELEVLNVHSIDPDSERGQEKIRRMRERRAKLDEAREKMRKLVEDAEKRKSEEEEGS